jgi:hypothetical protein
MQRKVCPPSRCPSEQFDLFAPSRRTSPSVGLAWQQLPENARQTLTRLLARLLLEHRDDGRRPDSAGGRHDV